MNFIEQKYVIQQDKVILSMTSYIKTQMLNLYFEMNNNKGDQNNYSNQNRKNNMNIANDKKKRKQLLSKIKKM